MRIFMRRMRALETSSRNFRFATASLSNVLVLHLARTCWQIIKHSRAPSEATVTSKAPSWATVKPSKAPSVKPFKTPSVEPSKTSLAAVKPSKPSKLRLSSGQAIYQQGRVSIPLHELADDLIYSVLHKCLFAMSYYANIFPSTS